MPSMCFDTTNDDPGLMKYEHSSRVCQVSAAKQIGRQSAVKVSCPSLDFTLTHREGFNKYPRRHSLRFENGFGLYWCWVLCAGSRLQVWRSHYKMRITTIFITHTRPSSSGRSLQSKPVSPPQMPRVVASSTLWGLQDRRVS